jgi:hypothetical protein
VKHAPNDIPGNLKVVQSSQQRGLSPHIQTEEYSALHTPRVYVSTYKSHHKAHIRATCVNDTNNG